MRQPETRVVGVKSPSNHGLSGCCSDRGGGCCHGSGGVRCFGTSTTESGSDNKQNEAGTVQQQQQQQEIVDPTNEAVSRQDLDLALQAVADESRKEADSSEPQIPGAQKGGKKLAIVFTCTVCGTRSAKQFTEQAYRNGVVLVRCPNCENLHLIADRLGFFEDESGDVEMALANAGESVKAVTNDNVLEVTLQDVLGSKLDEAVAGSGSAAAGEDRQTSGENNEPTKQ